MITIEHLEKTFETPKGNVTALEDVNLSIDHGQFTCIVGASGCGKSTLLKIIGGLEPPTVGTVSVDQKINPEPGQDRGMMFQSYTLYHWLTVTENIEFGPKLNGVNVAERKSIVDHLIRSIGLTKFKDLYPSSLSGGMQQRVALARMLANDPSILLMDEPFGALDAQTRAMMQNLLLKLWEENHKTVLFVTHDIDEAILLGDVIYVMSSHPGKVKKRITVDIPRPRADQIFSNRTFGDLKAEITELLFDENEKNMNLA
ncbi:ABC transporter ATP-binding protein [Geomicrobium sediminis]|uniref:ABC-type nitrate/sulfonate/bicarbonate transport system ATPase subunit n=1 Tax=Geomicrobium sediminis TaxID=1347788 RepID=A0ABS2PBM2_9BACL|nr:ABC transporter ATP-binding protein [Geomicrobium sediminis]MBM7632812.1 ABC-type nitrate/sulfonate/bicarbonate transport system ATPase subunit [Geomicrobium sediminis]